MEKLAPFFLQTGSEPAITRALKNIPRQLTLVILVAEGDNPDLAHINAIFHRSGFQYAGALFPKVIYADSVHDSGMVIFPLAADSAPVIINGLNNGQFNLHDLPDIESMKQHTLYIMLDGLSQHIAGFLRALYGRYGTDVVYLGGGAGSLSLKQAPCTFSNQGLAQDQAIIISYPKRMKLGVRHGWKRLMGPLIATEVENTIVKQINWQPALDVYKDVVEQESGLSINKQNFFDIAKGYPFGLEKNGAEDVVRDPIMVTDDGALICVGEITENSIIHILKGDPDELINSAKAASKASTCQNSNPLEFALIVDCISRTLFLEERFNEEIKCINENFSQHGSNTVTVGALTLGEISSIGDGYLEFLNKTVVIGTLD